LLKAIYQFNPDLKLIIVLRNPVKRAISAYSHFIRNGWIDFKENPNDYFSNPAPELSIKSGFIEQGYSFENIKAYLKLFPTENLKILFF
jgi:hypothetical protein